ncbi:hypothetical protein MCOR25_007307 [Pyricularia grisea]|nr:hypothetical protein MCOR25_007307 [Pyricularia grisea]
MAGRHTPHKTDSKNSPPSELPFNEDRGDARDMVFPPFTAEKNTTEVEKRGAVVGGETLTIAFCRKEKYLHGAPE